MCDAHYVATHGLHEPQPRRTRVLPRSAHESVRTRKLAGFAAAGFRRRAAVLVLPDRELFARQRRQYATDGKSVDELTMAEMRGVSTMYPDGKHLV